MGPVLRVDRAGGLLLLEVAADHGGGAQRVRQVRPAQLTAPVARVLPDAGEAVGLQLEAHGAGVRAGRILLVLGPDALQDAEERLHVMGDLVGHDVGLREVAQLDAGRARERNEEASV
jgi:hypothetical protein